MTSEDRQRAKDAFREVVRNTVEILGAVKDEVEHAIDDLRHRDDLSTENARQRVRDAVGRAQAAMDEAKERLDFVPRREFDELRDDVDALRERLDALEGREPAPGGAPGETGID